jgi:hypothetical protein
MPATLTATSLTVDLDTAQQARLELLQELPARLTRSDLDLVLALHKDGKQPRTIARTVALDELVVRIELARAGKRPAGEVARLTRREWNRLAKGTHVPNLPLRGLIAAAVQRRPGSRMRDILKLAGIKDAAHGDRLLGVRPYPGRSRPSQTISCVQAARLARAAGRDPHEVPGL